MCPTDSEKLSLDPEYASWLKRVCRLDDDDLERIRKTHESYYISTGLKRALGLVPSKPETKEE